MNRFRSSASLGLLLAACATACSSSSETHPWSSLLKPTVRLQVSSISAASADAGTLSASELARAQAYLESLYSSADIQHSFLTTGDEQIDSSISTPSLQ